jgi:D-alanyl-D-alanine carboxypeptidase (penicillin-binding protein 5/6)
MTGCGKTDTVENPYPVYSSALSQYENSTGTFSYFASDLCVTEDVNFGTETTDSQVAEAAGVFNLNTQEITYAQNIFERLYPASTTKILTAYIIIKYCNLDDMVTVSDNAVAQTVDSSVCNLKAGDVISVRDLLYGLLLASGNDAAVALAEYYAGSAGNFADVMNHEALSLGASASHFVNPNGLPDEDHYTTVYDMYLIFKEAIQYTDFVEIIQTASYTATYSDASGNEVNNVWNNTNRYINHKKEAPSGFTVIGGKSGTTGAAGYCLVLYSRNEAGEDIVSIVFKADGISNLYLLMNQILAGYAN